MKVGQIIILTDFIVENTNLTTVLPVWQTLTVFKDGSRTGSSPPPIPLNFLEFFFDCITLIPFNCCNVYNTYFILYSQYKNHRVYVMAMGIKTTHRPKEFYRAVLHPCSRVLEFLDPPLILFMMADFVVWSWKGNGWFRAKHMFTLGGYAFKSVSPVKPCKVVQKQGSPICMKFCEQVTLYPSIVNLNFFFLIGSIWPPYKAPPVLDCF